MKADPTVRKETCYILIWECALSVLMEAVFVVIRRWTPAVLLGNAAGACAAVGSFYLLGLTVQKCLGMPQEKVAARVRASQYGRLLMQLGVVLLAYLVLHADIIATVLPLLFPRIAIAFRPRFKGMDDAAPAASGGERTEGGGEEPGAPEASENTQRPEGKE